jgi:hypothetical protein
MKNPWLSLPESPPYVLEQDTYVIRAMNYAYGGTDRQIQTQLLPDPYTGNIEASILLLTKNSGFDEKSDPYWHTRDAFLTLMRKNIFQEPLPYPFVYLDPQLANSPGAQWHTKRLKWLIQDSSLKKVATNICSIPYFPYHTAKFSGIPKKITDDILPSQRYTKYLIRQAMDRKAVIVITLFETEWKKLVPELESYEKTYRLNSQNTSISPDNLDQYEELVMILRG